MFAVISDSSVELQNSHGGQVRGPFTMSRDWGTPNNLYLDGMSLRIDGATIHSALNHLPRVQFISFKAENGVGDEWTISNAPCSWQ